MKNLFVETTSRVVRLLTCCLQVDNLRSGGGAGFETYFPWNITSPETWYVEVSSYALED